MIKDKALEFSDSQAVTATAVSTGIVDLGATPATRNLGAVDDLYLTIVCTETAAAAGAATVTFSLESDSTADLATSATVHTSTGAIGKAALTAGAKVAQIKIPNGDYERYLGVRYTVDTGPLTAGKFDAFLTSSQDSWKAYPGVS